MKQKPWLLALYLMALWGFAMFTLGGAFERRCVYCRDAAINGASLQEETGSHFFATTPLVATVRFLDDEDFDAEYGQAEAHLSYAGFTKHGTPCVVTLRTGSVVHFDPALGYATWQNSSMNQTIAHELLHCWLGSWHGRWSEILMRRVREDAR
jgi:hypothetical protein